MPGDVRSSRVIHGDEHQASLAVRRDRGAARALVALWGVATLLGYAVAHWHWQGAASAAAASTWG
jgi:hypothetical protein